MYLAHEDRTKVSRSQYAVAACTIYRLDPDTSGGGNGKGKNK